MRKHEVFFLCTLAFLSGVAYASLGLSLLYSLIPAAIVWSALYASDIDMRIASLAAMLVVAGGFYFAQYQEWHPVDTNTPKVAADRSLFPSVKEFVRSGYDNFLPHENSVLLFGIIFGDNSGFSRQFANKLDLSGLRFITAIDGLHMLIMLAIVFAFFGYLLPRRYAFAATFIFAALFIALTGFTVSGIRAALMAFIARLAGQTARVYEPHNALAFIALVLTLLDPRTLLFDVGFQLSFLAVMAIIYFMPVVRSVLHFGDDKGFLDWKESFLITLSAQTATAPVIIMQFHTFSLVSFLSSLLIVWILPYILIIGSLLAASAFIDPLALGVGFVANALMVYVTDVVDLGAKFAVLFNPNLGFTGIALYYTVLIGVMYWYYSRQRPEEKIVKQDGSAPPISKEAAEFEIIEA